jgi:transposase
MRRRWVSAMLTIIAPERLVFLDESSCSTDMAREYGWAPVGERAFGDRPGRSWKTLTLIGAIRLGRKPQLMTHRGPINGKVFLRYVRRRLVPWLKHGDCVVLDNLAAHKVRGVQEAIEAAGAFVLYLPAYSPDMNPIELWWAHLKHNLRRIAARTIGELARAARRLRCATALEHLRTWFHHCLESNHLK